MKIKCKCGEIVNGKRALQAHLDRIKVKKFRSRWLVVDHDPSHDNAMMRRRYHAKKKASSK